MDFIDYYELLGVARSASQEEIQRQYRKLARQFHPDVNKEPEAADRFKKINEAYQVLKDPEKRAKYDQYGQAWKQAQETGAPPPGWEGVQFDFGGGGPGAGGFDFGDSGFSSFFEALFGMGGPQARGGPGGMPRGGRGGRGSFVARGQDLEHRVELTLEEAARGTSRQVVVGDPRVGASKTLDLKVPAGVTSGQKIRLSGQGGPGMGGGPGGDLFLVVDVVPHGRFRLEGNDLHVTVDVPAWTAAIGGTVEVPTLDGALTVKVPAGSSSGRRIRLKGKGFPAKKGGPGDLLAELRVVVPSDPSEEERELWQKLAEASSFAIDAGGDT